MLMPGRRGRVDNSSAASNRVRSQASPQAQIVGEIPAGGYFDVLEGPTCASNMAWFKVHSDSGVEGWMAEGTADGYWVMPIFTEVQTLTGPQVALPGVTLNLPAELGATVRLSVFDYEPEKGLPPYSVARMPGYSKAAAVYVYKLSEQLYYRPDRAVLLEQVRAGINTLLANPAAGVKPPQVAETLVPSGEAYVIGAGPFNGGYGYRAIMLVAPADGSRPAAPHYVFYGFTTDMQYLIYAAFEVTLTFGQLPQATAKDFTPAPAVLDGVFGLQAQAAGQTGGAGQVTSCPGAPAIRLQLGDWARVSVNPPLPSRIRSQPGSDGAVLGEAAPGSNVLIMAGPQCANGYAWWQVRTLTGLVGWTAEGDAAGYWLVEPISAWTSLPAPIDLQALRKLDQTGLSIMVPTVYNTGAIRTGYPMATPLPTPGNQSTPWPDDPRMFNHEEYTEYVFRSAAGENWMRIHTFPVTEYYYLNWQRFKDYMRSLTTMLDTGQIYPDLLSPFTGLEGQGVPVKVTVAARALAFNGGRGIRYLIGTHNATPVLNPIYYIFQGVSTDESHYVYVFIPVRCAYLPPTNQDLSKSFGPFIGWDDDPSGQNVQASYDVFAERITELLNAGELPLYPSLEVLDAMMASMTIQ
jgi:hypothetical protein